MEIINDRLKMLQILPKNMVIAELGVFMGTYSQKILELSQPAKLYLVDYFVHGVGNSMGEHCDDMATLFPILTERYKDNQNVYVIKSDTKTFLESIAPDILDMVYIDADHSYGAVKLDLWLSHLKVKNGGYLTGHDYDKHEVGMAVNEFVNRMNMPIIYLTDKKSGNQSFVIQNIK